MGAAPLFDHPRFRPPADVPGAAFGDNKRGGTSSRPDQSARTGRHPTGKERTAMWQNPYDLERLSRQRAQERQAEAQETRRVFWRQYRRRDPVRH